MLRQVEHVQGSHTEHDQLVIHVRASREGRKGKKHYFDLNLRIPSWVIRRIAEEESKRLHSKATMVERERYELRQAAQTVSA